MRRARAGFRSNSMVRLQEGEQGFWPSYADMMSSFALILFFLMLITYLQNLITGQALVSTQDVLKATQEDLAVTAQQVADAKAELTGVSLSLENAQAALLLQQEQIAEYTSTIDGQTTTIDQQTETIAAQRSYISLTTAELTRLRTQMQTIALLRLSILDQIKNSIAETLGDDTKVRVGENGSIILNEGLLFDYNSSKIKSASHDMLTELTIALSRFLSVEDNAKYVDSIVISGHTDNTGTDAKNRSLATDRANAVLDYLLEKNNGLLEPFASYFCAAGYGATRPVALNDTAAGRSANRRIEISILLKDESVLAIVDAYLKQEMPDVAVSPSPMPGASPTPMP